MTGLWRPGAYWPAFLLVLTSLFLVREVWALASRRPQDTLSDWVWRALRVTGHQPVDQWGAGHLLVAGCWVVAVTWLTFHFFLRWWV